MKRYLVGKRKKGSARNVAWAIECEDIQLRSTAVRKAKEIAKAYPDCDVEVWVEMTLTYTERVEKIQ